MNLIDYTTNWVRGELFEAKLIVAFGILTVVLAILFGKVGTTPNARALFIPLILVGSIYAMIGSGMLFSNNKRLVEMPQSYRADKAAFAQSEKKRVEDFQYQYTISKIVATACFALTLCVFWLSKNPTLLGVGIALSLFGLAGLVVDHFSEERARIYYTQILELVS